MNDEAVYRTAPATPGLLNTVVICQKWPLVPLYYPQVTPEGASVTSYQSQSTTWANFTPGTDLYFGLRGAGGSLGVVTGFLYTVYPHPETKVQTKGPEITRYDHI